MMIDHGLSACNRTRNRNRPISSAGQREESGRTLSLRRGDGSRPHPPAWRSNRQENGTGEGSNPCGLPAGTAGPMRTRGWVYVQGKGHIILTAWRWPLSRSSRKNSGKGKSFGEKRRRPASAARLRRLRPSSIDKTCLIEYDSPVTGDCRNSLRPPERGLFGVHEKENPRESRPGFSHS
jgi:hypothetical protein